MELYTKKMNKLICFDLDNTLVNSSKTHILAYNAAFEKLNLPKKSNKEISALLGMPKEEMIKKLQPKTNNIKKLCNLHSYFLQKKYYKFTKALPYVKSTLKELKKHYKLAIVSNSNKININYLLKGAKINKNLFDIIITVDNVKKPKPSPEEIFKAEKLTKSKTLYLIGDSIYDILTAKNAKRKSIIILKDSHTPIKELKKLKPDYILKNFKSLTKIL